MTSELVEAKRTGAAHNRGASKQDYCTPEELIGAIEGRFGTIAWDLAASKENRRTRDYFDEAQDSLTQPWHRLPPGLLFLNPPFGNIAPWARKCAIEADRGAQIAFLVPASVGSNWFRDYVIHRAQVCFLNPRVSFDGVNVFPKDVMLCYFGGPRTIEVWRWKP